jgi:hypothetical protein
MQTVIFLLLCVGAAILGYRFPVPGTANGYGEIARIVREIVKRI